MEIKVKKKPLLGLLKKAFRSQSFLTYCAAPEGEAVLDLTPPPNRFYSHRIILKVHRQNKINENSWNETL